MKLRKPSPSMVVAMTAMTVSLGGTSYAAVKLTSKDVKDNSLTSADIKNRSLKRLDFKKGQLPKGARGPAGVQGTAGLTGPAGAKGDKGDTGAAGAGRWMLVNAAGQIEAQSGGFSITSAYNQAGAPAAAVGNVYINANEDLSNNGIVAAIALQNQTEQGGDPTVKNGTATVADANPEFSGEITATRCQIAGIVECGPAAAKNVKNLVVSPRNSDGTPTTDATTTAGTTDVRNKRFSVVITGDSTDFVAP